MWLQNEESFKLPTWVYAFTADLRKAGLDSWRCLCHKGPSETRRPFPARRLPGKKAVPSCQESIFGMKVNKRNALLKFCTDKDHAKASLPISLIGIYWAQNKKYCYSPNLVCKAIILCKYDSGFRLGLGKDLQEFQNKTSHFGIYKFIVHNCYHWGNSDERCSAGQIQWRHVHKKVK